jgi:hypothetical protein
VYGLFPIIFNPKSKEAIDFFLHISQLSFPHNIRFEQKQHQLGFADLVTESAVF